MWEWIVKVWSHWGKEQKKNQAELNMGPRNGDSRFNMETHTVKRMLNFYLNDWLKQFSKDGLLKQSWRCPINLGLVWMKGF